MPLAYICDTCAAAVPPAKTHVWVERDTDLAGVRTFHSRRTAHLCERCASARVKALDKAKGRAA